MAPPQTQQPEYLYDYLRSFDAGVNAGIDPLLIPKNQLANATNCTVRGTFVTHRPAYRKINLTFSDESVQAAFENGLFQGGCYFNADQGFQACMAAISGRLFQCIPDALGNAVVTDHTVPVDPNPATISKAWLWQAEAWVIWQDGQSFPVFYDGTFSRRSNPLSYTYATVLTAFVVPNVGFDAVVHVLGTKPPVSSTVLIGTKTWTVKSHGPGDLVTFTNVNDTPASTVAVGTGIFTSGAPVGTAELPPGRMGAYGIGRNAVGLIDKLSFLFSDIVGGSSGTAAYKFRDSVLKVTENTFLNGGGTFKVPSSGDVMRSISYAALLDVSLGQGPLMIGTDNVMFSMNLPTNRDDWKNIGTTSNPGLIEALKAKGTQSQEGTISVNGDLVFRSTDGIRSLILGRRTFDTWGNVPQSREVQPTLDADNKSLLQHCSEIDFDNRVLSTAHPMQGNRGVYFDKLVALNLDPISSLRGKAPSVYDGVWTGLNVLQLITGTFDNVDRAFAFCVSDDLTKIELHEILTSADPQYLDNGTTRITWSWESNDMSFGETDPRKRTLKRLMDGEIYVDKLAGAVDFQALYKPDQYPNFVPWFNWTETFNPVTDPGFRPRMGIGEPDARAMDFGTNRPLREAYTFQKKMVITGHCRYLGGRYLAVAAPQPAFPKPKST